MTQESNTSNRSFGSMDEEQQRQTASKGGEAGHQKENAREFSSPDTAEAERKTGKAAHERGTTHEFDSEEAAEAGRKGDEPRSR